MESGNISLKYFWKKIGTWWRYYVVIGWHIIAFAFVTAHVLSSYAVLQNEDFWVIFIFSISKFDLDLTCCMQSPFPPWGQEKSRSHVEQKTYISTFFDFPKQSNMPSYHSQYLWQAIFDRCAPAKLFLSFPACFMEEKNHCQNQGIIG